MLSIRKLLNLKAKWTYYIKLCEVFPIVVFKIRLKHSNYLAHLQGLFPSPVLTGYPVPVILLNGPPLRVANGFCYLNSIISQDVIIVAEITVCLLKKSILEWFSRGLFGTMEIRMAPIEIYISSQSCAIAPPIPWFRCFTTILFSISKCTLLQFQFLHWVTLMK